MKDRITYYDLLRGLAIIGVVAIHTTGVGYASTSSGLDFNLTIVWRQLLNFCVPMFIAISGYFLANTEVDTKQLYLKFVTKQVPKVLIPYLWWSVIYLGIDYFHGSSPLSLLYRLLTFTSSVPFYFIALIIEYYLLLPLLKKLATPKGLIISALISALCCLTIFYFQYYTNIELPSFVVGSAPSLLIFFVMGIYLRNNAIKLNNSRLLFLVFSSLGLSLIETYLLYYKFNEIMNSVTAIKISSFAYSACLILFMFKNADKNFPKSDMLVYVGRTSFGIYLSHMFFMTALHSVLNKLFPALKESAIVYQLSVITLTIVCCLTLIIVARKFNERNAVRYLGL